MREKVLFHSCDKQLEIHYIYTNILFPQTKWPSTVLFVSLKLGGLIC